MSSSNHEVDKKYVDSIKKMLLAKAKETFCLESLKAAEEKQKAEVRRGSEIEQIDKEYNEVNSLLEQVKIEIEELTVKIESNNRGWITAHTKLVDKVDSVSATLKIDKNTGDNVIQILESLKDAVKNEAVSLRQSNDEKVNLNRLLGDANNRVKECEDRIEELENEKSKKYEVRLASKDVVNRRFECTIAEINKNEELLNTAYEKVKDQIKSDSEVEKGIVIEVPPIQFTLPSEDKAQN